MPLTKFNPPDLGMVPSASEVIAKQLRHAIITGVVAEGDPVRQDDVARLFKVSKIPVREALKRLEAEGLVEFKRNKGAVVTRISEPELAQMFEVRVLLEVKAITLAVPNMTASDLARADAICAAFLSEDDVGLSSELNWDFHACLYAPAQRPFMLELIRSIHDKLERYLRIQASLPAGKARADLEHRAIVAACRAGDAPLAAHLTEAHIEGVCQSLHAQLPQPGRAP